MSKGKINMLMKKNIAVLNLAPGDRIIIPKSEFRLVQHHGIYLGRNNKGIDLVAENKIACGVRIISLNEFIGNVNLITRIERFEGNNYERRKLVERIVSKLGQSYHLFDYNCQHFANDMLKNKIKSEQVDNLFEGLKIIASGLLTIGFLNAIAGSRLSR